MTADDDSGLARPRPRPGTLLLAWLPAGLGVLFLFYAENLVDAFLCLVLLGHAPFVLRLPELSRQRQLVIEMPAILLGTFGIAALLVQGMASMLGAPTPWGQAVHFGLYMGIWVLSLRLIYHGLRWLLSSLCKRQLLARVVAALVMIGFGMPQLFVALQTRRVAIGKEPNVYFADGVQREVQFETESGLQLRGTLLTQPAKGPDAEPGPRPVVIVCHGLGANRCNFFAYAHLAWLLDCHVFAFDFRGHGQSEGVTTTLGGREASDVVAATEWVRAEPQFAASKIVLLGISMGGASALRAAADANADAVFSESSFADLSTMLDDRMSGLGPLRRLASASVWLAARMQLGIDLDDVSPRQSLAALSREIPVVLVHAGDDNLIPVSQGRDLAAARPGLQLHVVAGAGHGGCIGVGWTQMQDLLRQLLASLRH